MIPYGRQTIDQHDVDAVVGVLGSDWLTQGPAVPAFEESLATSVGARYAVAFSSGTAALHAACAAGGLGPGDRVATSPLSFVASANCARYVGATPVFVDIERETLNLDPEAVPRDVAALVAVHYAGLPLDLARLSRRPRVVIEDAAHALGASTPDGPVGNCARSDMCCFSFHPVKAITTGEGGAVTTNDPHLAEGLRRFRHHGIVPRPDEGGWYYDVADVGFNYRLTDVQAALGNSQIERLEEFIGDRNRVADRYRELLANLPIGLPPAAPTGYRHAYHLFAVQVAERRQIYDGLRARGINVQVHYVPTYRFSSYRGFGSIGDFPVTEAVYEQLVSLPIFPRLSTDAQDSVIEALEGLVSDTIVNAR
jgi:UDP-4-amino-4,6-dideoxy-N-acetyl-beta-L-altrosamine transaminase